MRLIHQIFIIIFIVASLILAKDDVFQIYDRSVDYLGDKISIILNKDEDNPIAENQIQENEILKPEKTIARTPGALKITDNVLNISKAELSSKIVIGITNQERSVGGGLPALKENQKLNLSAEKKVADMFARQYFEHISPDGVGVSELASLASYEYITVGENLAMGNFKDDQALVDAWMASEGHRENILNKNYTEIGVAVREGTFQGKKVWLAVQHFGTSKDVCPEIDESLRGIIAINEQEAERLENELSLRLGKINDRVVYEEMSTSEQVDKYNSLIEIYNKLILELKEKINNYNNQVKIFNSCLAENTTEIIE